MHEHGIADQVLETILHHPDRPPNKRPVVVSVMVAELGGLAQEALQSALDHVCEHHGLPAIRVALQTVEFLGECPECGTTQAVAEDLKCLSCGGEVRLCAGETILVQAIDYA